VSSHYYRSTFRAGDYVCVAGLTVEDDQITHYWFALVSESLSIPSSLRSACQDYLSALVAGGIVDPSTPRGCRDAALRFAETMGRLVQRGHLFLIPGRGGDPILHYIEEDSRRN